MNEVKGYKVFNPDWTCRGFQYAAGETYEEDVKPSCGSAGMHFCRRLSECFHYYDFNHKNHVAEVLALGEVDYELNSSKACTNKIMIGREIPWGEVLRIVNEGENCTGVFNTGDCNTGDRNTGDGNAGNRNTGSCNTGDRNTGDGNAGNRNTGDRNTGHGNTGDFNTGDFNTGHRNTGNRNTGDRNTGNRNTGNRNKGNWNTGSSNTGNFNTGDWNKSSFNTGCFMTMEEPQIMMFNKPSDWTHKDWMQSEARHLLKKILRNVVEWVNVEDMTDEEKEQHPEYETTGGYLRVLDKAESGQIWWDSLTEKQKNIITGMPNFDLDIFKQCTGITAGE